MDKHAKDLDTMCKAELVLLCEKLGVPCPRTVALIRAVLREHLASLPPPPDPSTAPPPPKKSKSEPGAGKPTAAAAPAAPIAAVSPLPAGGSDNSNGFAAPGAFVPGPLCPQAGGCTHMHVLSHRLAYRHGAPYRDQPFKCRDGSACPTLKDAVHLAKYAHDLDAAKACPHGAACPELHVLSHRLAFEHAGFRAQPFPCRDAMACPLLKDRGHLYKYAHDIPGTSPPSATAAAAPRPASPGLALPASPMVAMPAPAPVLAASTAAVPLAAGSSPGPLTPAGSTPLVVASPSVVGAAGAFFAAPTPSAATSLVSVASLATATTLSSVGSVFGGAAAASSSSMALAGPAGAPSLSPSTVAAGSPATAASATAESVIGKTLADFPLESAVDAVLTEVVRDSEEFWDLEDKFAANLQGRNEDYVAKRIKAGKKPLRFVLVGAERVDNPILAARFEIKKREIFATLDDPKERRERISFHGTHPRNLASILKTSLLRFKHKLNPCKTQSDEGYFGTNRAGVYVSRYADYTLKYSNRVCALEPGDEVKTVMFRTVPGRTKRIEKLTFGIQPTEGYNSHSSPTFLEWYLFDEAQLCPQYVLRVKAVEDTRTAADDE